ncbi:hypothetical protein ACTXT7_011774 [Hymenolepis weldensis]
MTQRNVSQAANTPKLTQLPLRETSPILTPALSLVLQKNAFFNLPAWPCKRQTITFSIAKHLFLLFGPPINQDLNMAESLNLNCKQPSKTTNSAMEFETELLQTNIR